MKKAPYRDIRREQDSADNILKEEGADVGGPRWRIGWGGLAHDNDNDDLDRVHHD